VFPCVFDTMLIPSIDLQAGRIVQLVQGERLALVSADFEGWIERFKSFPKVQVIDLDAAKGDGDNASLVEMICSRLPCRVGGGVRSAARAATVLARGAKKVILGSALFSNGRVDVGLAKELRDMLGEDRLIAAVDARGGRVTIHGWRTRLEISTVEAVQTLEPFFSEFLFTNVDTEGLMQGANRPAIEAVREATKRGLTAAGGITTQEEVDWLDSIGVDAVVGMAVYTGRLKI
jgi:phosphoribosylformimino-5-aminoimidazole carboxamide ribotide isomerase